MLDTSGCIHAQGSCEQPFMLGTVSGFKWVYLFDGPVNADGHEWYLAATEMNTEEHASTYPEAIGWVAAGDGEDAWLVPDERSCPAEPIELADVTNLALTKLEMLHCLGGEELTLHGWYPPLPPGESEANLDECRASAPWLRCSSVLGMIRVVESSWAGDADYLDFVIDPASGVVMPARGQWITVTGTFAHPAATECGDEAEVLLCRLQFVLTRAEAG